MTKVLEQQMLDNSDLKSAQHEIERQLRSTMVRMKALETALKEVQEDSARDRKRYENEMDETREAARQERLARLGLRTPTIGIGILFVFKIVMFLLSSLAPEDVGKAQLLSHPGRRPE